MCGEGERETETERGTLTSVCGEMEIIFTLWCCMHWLRRQTQRLCALCSSFCLLCMSIAWVTIFFCLQASFTVAGKLYEKTQNVQKYQTLGNATLNAKWTTYSPVRTCDSLCCIPVCLKNFWGLVLHSSLSGELVRFCVTLVCGWNSLKRSSCLLQLKKAEWVFSTAW